MEDYEIEQFFTKDKFDFQARSAKSLVTGDKIYPAVWAKGLEALVPRKTLMNLVERGVLEPCHIRNEQGSIRHGYMWLGEQLPQVRGPLKHWYKVKLALQTRWRKTRRFFRGLLADLAFWG